MNRILLLSVAASLVVVAVVAATHTVPTSSLRFTAAGDSVVIPFILRNNHVLVRGTLGDSDSLWFLVDSGAGAHCVNTSAAKRLGISVGGGVEARGTGGTVKAGAARDLEYRVPGLIVDAPFAAAIDLDAVALQIGAPIDGVLGFPLFEQSVLTVDYDRSQLVLHAPKFQPVGAVLPLTFHDNHPYVPGRLTLPGRAAEAGTFFLDTGTTLALTLAPEYVEQSKARAAVTKTIEGRTGGVGGLSYQPLGRLERLALGPYALERPVAVLSQPGPGHISAPGSIGSIGGDVLQRFRVTFDYPRRQLRLVAGRSFGRPFEADMTGMILNVRPDGDHAVEIARVAAGSPAAEAGVEAGDVLVSVDGKPLTAGDLAALRTRMRTEGERMRLGLVRGTNRPDVVLTTRRML